LPEALAAFNLQKAGAVFPDSRSDTVLEETENDKLKKQNRRLRNKNKKLANELDEQDNQKNTNLSAGAGGGSSCFAADAVIAIQRDGVVSTTTMDQLQVGDLVATASGFEAVTGFLHKSATTPTLFHSVSFGDDSSFSATPEHRVFLADGSSTTVGAIKTGDVLLQNGLPTEVQGVTQEIKTGFFAPLTTSGTIIVDDVLASTFAGGPAGSVYQTICKMAMAPIQFFGVIPQPATTSTSKPASIHMISHY